MASARASVRTLGLRSYACDVSIAQVVREGVEVDCCPRDGARGLRRPGGTMTKIASARARGSTTSSTSDELAGTLRSV